MSPENIIHFKIADSADEYEQVHRLNYATFVKEIPQHAINKEEKLIDKFNTENTYVIAVTQELKVIGMLALRGNRPFSLDHKLPELDNYLPTANKIFEIRLLSVIPAYRNSRVLLGLLKMAVEYGLSQSVDLVIISGILSQQRLYKNMGFIPFGPLVGNEQATFQPMYLPISMHTPIIQKTATY